jgi:serine/threonine-protein kinase
MFSVAFTTLYYPTNVGNLIEKHMSVCFEIYDCLKKIKHVPCITSDINTLLKFVLENDFRKPTKESTARLVDTIMPELHTLTQPTSTVLTTTTSKFYDLYNREDHIIRRQRRREILRASSQQRKLWVVDRITTHLHRTVIAWLLVERFKLGLEGIEIGESFKVTVILFLQVWELDRKEGGSYDMHRCGRSTAFQLLRAINLLMVTESSESAAVKLEALYSVDGSEHALLEYAENVFEEVDENSVQHEVEVVSTFLAGLLKICSSAENSEDARETTLAISNLVSRQHKKRRSQNVRGHLLRLQCGVFAEHTALEMRWPTPLLEAMCSSMYSDVLRGCKEIRTLTNNGRTEKGSGLQEGELDAPGREIGGLFRALFRMCGGNEFPSSMTDLHILGFVAKELECAVEQNKKRKEKEAKEKVERERAEKERAEEERKRSMVYALGDRVDVKFDINGRDRWYPGVVLVDEQPEYCVLFDDGDYKQNLTCEEVRKSKNKRQPPAASIEALEMAKKEEGWHHSKHVVKVAEAVVEADEEMLEEGEELLDGDLEESFGSGTFDPLDESDTGMFLAIPTTLPMKSSLNVPTIGIRSLPKEDSEKQGLSRGFSLPNLPVRTSLSGAAGGGGGGDRYSPFSCFDSGVQEVALALLLRGLTKGGKSNFVFPRQTSVEDISVVAAWSPLVATSNIVRAMGGEAVRRVMELLKFEGEKRLLQMLVPPVAVEGMNVGKDDGTLGSYATLGSGNFGDVKRVGDGMAVKVMPRNTSRCDVGATLHALYGEISALQKCAGCKGCIQMVGFGSVGEFLWIVTEFAEGGNLRGYREALAEEMKTPAFFLKVWGRVCDGVRELHDRGVVHHDLKSENVLLRHTDWDRDDCVCVCDFGEATFALDAGGVTRARGTECIQSPEVVLVVERSRQEGEGYDRRKVSEPNEYSDVWQLGCLLFEVIVGEYLFGGGEEGEEFGWAEFFVLLTDDKMGELPLEGSAKRVRKSVVEEKEGEEGADVLVAFMRSCLQRKMERRPSASDLVKQVEGHLKAKTISPRR